ncbi:hypothetical protein OG897_35755 [Streptomyces sp. NBC_00237]|uniref:hypothetical protein n=1 Tax=Streptomyces sp. NBC_00237 TaxID=2975687 RepID=UPI002251CABE|nr:hypothetical protein [Streptomyces sp. NBC_00237]MCX5206748.1 hypothetical protein [Streptomyces sp. NBC_00237]
MIDRSPMNRAVQELLAKVTGKPCGLGALPLAGGKPAPLPYTVLYPLGGSVSGAPLADLGEDAVFVYQVTAVGARTDQAEWLADKVRRAILGRTSTGAWANGLGVPGVDVWARDLDADAGTDDTGASDGVVTSSQRYRISATSTPEASS